MRGTNKDHAIKWACLGVLKQAWPNEQREVEAFARQFGRRPPLQNCKNWASARDEAKLFSTDLEGSGAMFKVRIWWTGDADVDLSVMDPTATFAHFEIHGRFRWRD